MWDWFINFLTMVLEGLHGVSGDWGLLRRMADGS